jgi:hypothetical protein
VLRRLSQPDAWASLECNLWSSTVAVYEIEVADVRLDNTNVSGYHTLHEKEVKVVYYG